MDLLIFAFFVALTGVSSSLIRKAHVKKLNSREAELLNINITNTCRKQDRINDATKIELISGSFVLSVNYFEQLISGLKNIFGGQISLFEDLLARGRREAVVRMKEKAKGAYVVSNVRIETSVIGKNMVEVYAYATAIYK